MILLLACLVALVGAVAAAAPHDGRPLRIDDVLDMVTVDQASASPAGDWIAAVVQRPAHAGEVYGRTAYEVDPSRSDVYLVSRRDGRTINLTGGAATAAGFWCASWSPDGRRLAMLSTKPERGEPRGGDNVRLYVWDAGGGVRRVAEAAMATQTRYGSPMYAMDARNDATGSARTCRAGDENPPFVWLDDDRILAVTLPRGGQSALLDQFGRPPREEAAVEDAMRRGTAPTASSSSSGLDRTRRGEGGEEVVLRIVDVRSGRGEDVGRLPMLPFQGALTLLVSPDRRSAAVLTPVDVLPADGPGRPPVPDDDWAVAKRLGVVDLVGGGVRWTELPAAARLPLDLMGWSPDSASLMFRARPNGGTPDPGLFVLRAGSLGTAAVDAGLDAGTSVAGPMPRRTDAFWLDGDEVLVFARRNGTERRDWWLAAPGRASRNLTATLAEAPDELASLGGGSFVGVSKGRLVLVAPSQGAVRIVAPAPVGASLMTAVDAFGRRAVFLASESKGRRVLDLVRRDGGRRRAAAVPSRADVVALDHGLALWREAGPAGLSLNATDLRDGSTRPLMTVNGHLSDVRWGRRLLVSYEAADGSPQKAAVILPPNYREGVRYPTIVWVYLGFEVHDLENYFTDLYLPGVYNLQLYAARGYVVLIPSMPWERKASGTESRAGMASGVLPAVDRLVALGIADGDRVGVMGQSFGGYSVYSLVTQTDRFRAAVAMSGTTDLAQFHMQFDPLARGRGVQDQDRSVNWSIAEVGNGMGSPPWEDPDLYRRNSPITYVDRVRTPLLMVHGQYDVRASLGQAETFFDALYRQGRTARLLRYWGESHSLARSPANVRDIVREVGEWFDRYLASRPVPPRAGGTDANPH